MIVKLLKRLFAWILRCDGSVGRPAFSPRCPVTPSPCQLVTPASLRTKRPTRFKRLYPLTDPPGYVTAEEIATGALVLTSPLFDGRTVRTMISPQHVSSMLQVASGQFAALAEWNQWLQDSDERN